MKIRILKFILILLLLTLPSIAFANSMEIDGKWRDKVSKQKRGKLVKKTSAMRRAEVAAARLRAARAAEARQRKAVFEAGLKTKATLNIANDHVVGQDPKVRAAAISALGDRVGTVVVMEPQTGRVLAIVNEAMAIGDPIKPCSVIKLVTGIAGLKAGAIGADGKIIGSPNSQTLETATAESRNPFFRKLGEKVGNDQFIEVAKELGLGSTTGINLPGESPGSLPYGSTNSNQYWKGDGTEITAIQAAVMIATIVNNGKKVKPVIPALPNAPITTVSKQVNLPLEALEGVIPGMQGSATNGTAKVLAKSNPSLEAASKTGTCIDRSQSVYTGIGLNASAAPISNPKYVVVVITHGQGQKGIMASLVAKEIYKVLIPPPPEIPVQVIMATK